MDFQTANQKAFLVKTLSTCMDFLVMQAPGSVFTNDLEKSHHLSHCRPMKITRGLIQYKDIILPV